MCPLTCKASNLSKEIIEPKMGVATIWFCGNFPPYSKNDFYSACITATISPALTHWSSTSSPLMALFNNNNNIYLTAIGFSPGGSGF
jgi:hypothetical protein